MARCRLTASTGPALRRSVWRPRRDASSGWMTRGADRGGGDGGSRLPCGLVRRVERRRRGGCRPACAWPRRAGHGRRPVAPGRSALPGAARAPGSGGAPAAARERGLPAPGAGDARERPDGAAADRRPRPGRERERRGSSRSTTGRGAGAGAAAPSWSTSSGGGPSTSCPGARARALGPWPRPSRHPGIAVVARGPPQRRHARVTMAEAPNAPRVGLSMTFSARPMARAVERWPTHSDGRPRCLPALEGDRQASPRPRASSTTDPEIATRARSLPQARRMARGCEDAPTRLA